jgi:hypothetical protein
MRTVRLSCQGIGHYGGQQKCVEIFDGETCGPEIAVRLWLTLKHTIEMDLQETDWPGVNWTALDQDTDNWQAVVIEGTSSRIA